MTTKSVIAQKMQDLKLNGCLNCFVDHYDEMVNSKKTSLEILNELLIAEQNEVSNRKILSLLNKSNIRYPTSSLTEIDCSNKKGLTSDILQSFADCEWIKSKHNLIFTGATGIGKTWLASAFGTNACKLGFKVIFYNTTELFEDFNTAVNLGTISTLKKRLLSCKLLILDDFGLTRLEQQHSLDLMEMIEDRHGKHATIIASQIPVASWYDLFAEETLADAILDRLVYSSYRIELKGESLRKKR